MRAWIVVAVVLTACSQAAAPGPAAPLAPEVRAALEALSIDEAPPPATLERIVATGDRRLAWPLVDLLRFHRLLAGRTALAEALTRLTGSPPPQGAVPWVAHSNDLLADDVPAPPGYVEFKHDLYRRVHPPWEPFLDPDADLDWRVVVWGGVGRDGIPALTDPPTQPAADAAWVQPDDVVFGVILGGEARAYPRRVLEVHELVNDRLGGQRFALPYCTLCGAAVGYATGGVAGQEWVEMRTSGLLQRANKLMYDTATESLFDQLRGVGVSGPLRGLQLEQLPVVTTTWAEWQAAQPDTTVLRRPSEAGDLPGGDVYDGTFLGGRDDDGPVFPVGEPDDRLPAGEPVLGVATPDGAAVAFPVTAARAALDAGRPVAAAGVEVHLESGGLAARSAVSGVPLPAFEARWFAWSQTRPDTLLWAAGGTGS